MVTMARVFITALVILATQVYGLGADLGSGSIPARVTTLEQKVDRIEKVLGLSPLTATVPQNLQLQPTVSYVPVPVEGAVIYSVAPSQTTTYSTTTQQTCTGPGCGTQQFSTGSGGWYLGKNLGRVRQ